MVEASTAVAPRPFFEMPSPSGHFLTGHLGELQADYMGLFHRGCDALGDCVRYRFLHQQAAFFRHPDEIDRILIKNHRNYAKQTRGYNAMRIFLGNGLVTSEGDFWLRQRRLTQPSFHKKRIHEFVPEMIAAGEAMAQKWEDYAKRGVSFDVCEEMMKLTLRIVSRTLLSTELDAEAIEATDSLDVLLNFVIDRVHNPLSLPLSVPTPYNLRVRRAMKVLDDVVHKIIEERRSSREFPPDLLSMWMEATDEETGEAMTDKQLRDEVMTMFLAGHETTANMLNWIWYLLDGHRSVEEALHEELDRVLNGRLPTLEDLRSLTYTRMVIDEALRLYPPVPVVARWSLEDDELGGFHLPKDIFVLFAPYVTHRHPDFWPEPERFDPERFRAPAKSLPRFAYFPFLGGPRQCIGNNFALLEGQLLLAILASRFRVRRTEKGPVGLDVTVTLRPQGGLPVTLEARP